ncbi:DUF2961 domain-containing protein [Pelomyxa schiedti]|nr:DUF2961 domain-containing protein [Pelomyxa schiedti]
MSVIATCLALLGAAVTVMGGSFYMGNQGESCSSACHSRGLNCNPHVVTNDSATIFQQLGVSCTANSRAWRYHYEPAFVSDSKSLEYKQCIGYIDVPGGVLCGHSDSSVSRLCYCDSPSHSDLTFGFGLSSAPISTSEQIVFQHIAADGDYGVITHFWMTIPTEYDRGILIRYYVDGESEASIEYEPSLACGVGFDDHQAPWGTHWLGRGAKYGSWFNNFLIPFQKSIIVTAQHTGIPNFSSFYMIIRGATNVPLKIGYLTLPVTAKLHLFTFDKEVAPLEYVNFVNISTGSGVMFMHTLQVETDNLNFLEGCYHMYTGAQEFPGTVLSTGTEDYYDSGWYFDAGEFHMPVSGYTHYDSTITHIEWSGYRFHHMDPLQFNEGFVFQWRNGDSVDAAGIKCMMEEGGTVIGSPSSSSLKAYTWVYTF